MPTSLTNLPFELLTQILDNVKSQATLYNLAATSHELYIFTMPRLCRAIAIRKGSLEGEEQGRQLQNLTSLLIQRTDLTSLVQHFTLYTISCKNFDDSESFDDKVDQSLKIVDSA